MYVDFLMFLRCSMFELCEVLRLKVFYDGLKLYFFANDHNVSLFVTALIITILVTTMSNQIDF